MMTFVDPRTAQDMEVWDGRATLSTLADALAKLQELGAPADEDHAQIRTIPMRLPDGGTAAIVEIIPRVARPRRSILMPSSTGFTAKDTLGAQHGYEIGRLDGAIDDADGNVQLRDGTYVHAVELVPARLVRELTLEQEKILRLAINFLQAEKRCYRPLHESLLPGLVALDYAAVAALGAEGLPPLKAIERHVAKHMPGLSRQTIANTLAVAGLRRPRSGPRAHPAPRPKRVATVLP